MTSAAVSGLVLAGGRSRRLGIDKTTMAWPPAPRAGEPIPSAGEAQRAAPVHPAVARQTLLLATAGKLAAVCDEVLLVGFRGTPGAPYKAVPDLYPEGGSLGGIYAGLYAAQHNVAIAVATDMPFLSVRLLRWMLSLPRDYDVLVPVREEPEPLHAIYTKACLEPMRLRLEGGRLKITGFFEDVRVRYLEAAVLTRLDPQGHSFFNINTPEDLERARAILAQSSG